MQCKLPAKQINRACMHGSTRAIVRTGAGPGTVFQKHAFARSTLQFPPDTEVHIPDLVCGAGVCHLFLHCHHRLNVSVVQRLLPGRCIPSAILL